jgi:hypothetical protein
MQEILQDINKLENELHDDLQKLIMRVGNKKVIKLSDVEECENECLKIISEYRSNCVKLFMSSPSFYNMKFADTFSDRVNNITISTQNFLQQMQDLLDE